jgi:type I restriction enzyme, S subunit
VTKGQIELAELPRGWLWSDLRVLYDIVGGGTPSTAVTEYWQGKIPWITSADIHGPRDVRPRKAISKKAIADSTTNLVPPGSLIVVTRVGLGKIAIAEHPLCFSQDSQGLVGINDLLDPKYALHYLSMAVQIFQYENRGTTISGVTKKQLEDLQFPLAPTKEQVRVVEKIEELLTKLDAGVEELRKAQKQLKRYRRAILKAAVTGELTKQWREAHQNELEPASELLARILKERRKKWEADQLKKMKNAGKTFKSPAWKERYNEPPGPEEKHRPTVPAQWSVASAEQLTSIITDGEHITPERAASGVLLLSARNILDGRISLEKVDHVPEHVFEVLSKRLTIEPGDVLLSCSGSVGRSCVAPDGLKFTLVRSVAVLKPVLSMGRFLSYALRSFQLQAQIEERKTQTAQANIFQGKIRKLVFPLPPHDEQARIVEELERYFSVADEMQRTIYQSLKQAERMRQSILKKAFEGKLVPQDANDEPAELLLERIKQERAKRGAEKRATLKPSRRRPNRKHNKQSEGVAV